MSSMGDLYSCNVVYSLCPLLSLASGGLEKGLNISTQRYLSYAISGTDNIK